MHFAKLPEGTALLTLVEARKQAARRHPHFLHHVIAGEVMASTAAATMDGKSAATVNGAPSDRSAALVTVDDAKVLTTDITSNGSHH
jgi:uncharacterized surface protein with fasciclin (FAS1) repeats